MCTISQFPINMSTFSINSFKKFYIEHLSVIKFHPHNTHPIYISQIIYMSTLCWDARQKRMTNTYVSDNNHFLLLHTIYDQFIFGNHFQSEHIYFMRYLFRVLMLLFYMLFNGSPTLEHVENYWALEPLS